MENIEDHTDDLREWILDNRSQIDRELWVDPFIPYNVFKLPHPAFFDLFFDIKNSFYEKAEAIGAHNYIQYYIHGWVNIFNKGDRIHWHNHCTDERPDMFHGVYCVDPAGESHTEYRDFETKEITETITSKQGKGHFVCDMTTDHRSSINNSEEPRITIAFDIIPYFAYERSHEEPQGKHFIPFV